MEQLRHECIQFIKNANKSGIQAIKYYALAERFDIENIKSECAREIACVPHATLKGTEEYIQADDTVKNMILEARVQWLETLIDSFKPVVNSLLRQMYQCAHTEFERYLRGNGLEESILNRCTDYEKHTDKKIGQKFDIHCKTCRKNTMLSKEFVVNTKETNSVLEQLYLLTKNMEEITITEQKHKL